MKLIKSALAVALSLVATTTYANDTLTLEDLTKIKSVGQTVVSPDGDSVAFLRSVPREIYIEKDGVNYTELHISDAKGNERAFITGKVNVSALEFSADGQFIYFLSKFKEDKFKSLYRMPLNGGQWQKVLSLKGTSISSYDLSPDNKKIAIIAKPAKPKKDKELKKLGFKAETYELGLTNAELMVLDLDVKERPVSLEGLKIDAYVSDVNWANSGNKLLIKTQPTALIDDKYMQSSWHVYDLSTNKKTLSFSTEGKLGAAEFSNDGKHVAILGAEDKHDPATGRLYLADAQTGEIKEWVPNFPGHISDFEWANKSNTLHFVAQIDTESFIATIKPNTNKYKTTLKRGKLIAGRLSISDSDKTVAFSASSRIHPNEAYVLRGKKESRVSNSNTWLADKRLAKQDTISFKAEDGTQLDGVLVYPLDYKKGTRYPLIMSVHGGPESHDKDGWVTNYSRPGQVAAAKGYAVLYPNYRGSTGKGVEYSKLGQNDYAGEEFNDLVRFKQHLVDKGLVDSDRVGITGGSYGGYASAWAATKLTEHFATSVMFVGVTNQLSKFGTTDISNEMHLVHARSYPWEKWQWYLERSPIYWAGQSETPLLIMHGKDDPRVHPAQSMELYRYMKVQGKDVRLVYYPGEGHGNRKMAAKYDYSIRLMRWMDNYLLDGNKTMPDYKIDHAAKLKAAKESKK